MIKIIGAVLLVAGTAAWGLAGVMRLRNRAKNLAALASAVGAMKSEICDRLTPTPEVFEMLAAEAQYPANLLFRNASERMGAIGQKPFSDIWRGAAENTPELLLNAGEIDALCELGLFLGRYNVEEQRSAFDRAGRRLEEFTGRAESLRDTNSRMHAFLGVAAGLFAVVVLI